MYDTVASLSFGKINQTTALMTTTGTFTSSVYSNQAAFNTSDNCYYVFRTHTGNDDSPSPLYKIDASGAVTALTRTDAFYYSSLTYNRVTNKLYCITNKHLAVLSISGTTFSATYLDTALYPFEGPLTVDNNTGDLYYATGDTINYHIEKYHLGSTASTVVASGTGAWDLLGLKFNKNDNMLYAIRENYPLVGNDFIKINPATGVISTITPLSIAVNREYYSACIDPCSNHYILSTAAVVAGNIFVLDQLSMTGSVLQNDTTATLYQGLDVN